MNTTFFICITQVYSRCIKDFGEHCSHYVIDIISQTCLLNCHLCQRCKPKQKQGTPHDGYIPKDYTPLEHLAVDIKYMPDGFDGFRFLIMVTCKQTNFVYAIPSKDRTARAILDALIHRVFAVSGPPPIFICQLGHSINGYGNTNSITILTVLNANY